MATWTAAGGFKLKENCLAFTSYFETGDQSPECFGRTAGNFDGAGTSWGAIQENFGQTQPNDTLSPIWLSLINNHPSVCSASFSNQADYTYWRDLILSQNYTNIKAWSTNITDPTNAHKVIEPWSTNFYKLGITDESRQAQIDAANWYYSLADTWKQKWNLWTRRGYALLFDIAVQSGSISTTAQANIDADIANLVQSNYTREEYEHQKLLIIANRKADEVRADFQVSYRERKTCIANGGGYVPSWGETIDPDDWGLGLQPAWTTDEIGGSVPSAGVPVATNPIYCYDRTEKLLCVLDIKGGDACPYYNASMKEVLNGEFSIQFSVPYSNPDAQLIAQDGYAAAKDNNGVWQLFCITRIEDDHINYAERTVYGEHAEIELLDNLILEMTIPLGTTVGNCIGACLVNTRWSVGDVNDSRKFMGVNNEGTTLKVKMVSARQALNIIQGQFGTGDFTFVTNKTATGWQRLVQWDATRGTNTGRRFEYSKDLIEVKREIDTSNIKTALIGLGGDETAKSQPLLKCTPLAGGQFSWHIEGLGAGWGANHYTYASVFNQPFKDFTSDQPAGTVQQIYPPTGSGVVTATPETTAGGLVSGQTYTFYGGVKTPSGRWFNCGQHTITLL